MAQADLWGRRVFDGTIETVCPTPPERCSRCGALLGGMAVDHPDGWLCAIDCGRPRELPISRDYVPFSQTGLDRP